MGGGRQGHRVGKDGEELWGKRGSLGYAGGHSLQEISRWVLRETLVVVDAGRAKEGCNRFQDQSWMGDSSKHYMTKELGLENETANNCKLILCLISTGLTLEAQGILSWKSCT